jgi:hypothetical protein
VKVLTTTTKLTLLALLPNACVAKPIDLRQLFAAINSALAVGDANRAEAA